jgi:tetratricopeptide (TPR) repeat protein
MRSRLTPLFKLIYNPLQAMALLRAEAPYLTGIFLALASSVIYYDGLTGELTLSYLNAEANSGRAPGLLARLILLVLPVLRHVINNAAPLLFLAAVFIPACLLAASLVDQRSSFRVLFRQEYAPLSACAFYSWSVAHLIMSVAGWALFRAGEPSDFTALESALWLLPLPYFIFLITLALNVVLRLSYGRAVGVMAMAALSLIALPLLPRLLYLLTSPFLLILVILLFRNVLGDVFSAQRARANFERNLATATLNPADASAHYNLGLIYQQRGQVEEAKASFRRAIEIDPDEADAHYQLGRIAREEGMLAEAIAHFEATVQRDQEHGQHEIWREIGRTYLQAGQYEDARNALERFLQRRPSDAEGRYHHGLALYRLGRAQDAATEMRACIEAVRTSPAYKYRAERHWMNEAQAFLRSQSV